MPLAPVSGQGDFVGRRSAPPDSNGINLIYSPQSPTMADHILLLGGDQYSRLESITDLRHRDYEVTRCGDIAEGQCALAQSLAATPASTDKITLTFDREPTLAKIEQSYLKLLLERRPGSRADLARVMGIGERTLYRLLADLKA